MAESFHNISAGSTNARAALIRILAAAVNAVEPSRLTGRALTGALPGADMVPGIIASAARLHMIAVGKAALRMAMPIEAAAGPTLAGAVAIVPSDKGSAAVGTESSRGAAGSGAGQPELTRTRTLYASHPIPDESSEAAGRAALELAKAVGDGELLVVALSGGASALMVQPAPGITLADKIAITESLYRAGAPIREVNAVRKHLSAIKGGGLLRALTSGARCLSLVLSDVPGNDLGTIGSGIAAADPTTFADAIGILKRRGLWGRAPEPIRGRLECGLAGELPETLKPGAPEIERVRSLIIGDNGIALEAAGSAEAALGYEVVPDGRDLAGEANDLGRAMAADVCAIERGRVCVIAGGEPVVTVRGGGRGGRAQQCALAMALELGRICPDRHVMALFAGTDGVDGPTDAAGAFAAANTIARAAEAGLNAGAALARNNTYGFFRSLGDLVITGPTGTNVNDIFIALVNY